MRLRNPAIFLMRMFSVRRKRNDRGTVSSACGKFIIKLKDKKLKMLYQKAIDKIREDHTVGEAKTGDLACVYGYDIYYHKTNYKLAYTVEYLENKVIVVIMTGTRENFYDQLKQYRKKRG